MFAYKTRNALLKADPPDGAKRAPSPGDDVQGLIRTSGERFKVFQDERLFRWEIRADRLSQFKAHC